MRAALFRCFMRFTGRLPSELKQLCELHRLRLDGNDALEKPPGCPMNEYMNTFTKKIEHGMLYYGKEQVAALFACLP